MSVKEILELIMIGLQMIPLVILVIAVIKRTIELAKAKDWNKVYELLMELIKEAEPMFDTGSTRKEWVMNSLHLIGKTLGYKYDENQVSQTIDDLCAMSKVVNATPEVIANIESIEDNN